VAAQFFLILSSAGLLAAVVPFLPDLNYIINNLLMLLFFLSGVLFDLNKMPESFRPYLSLNPLAVLIADYRTVLLDGEMPGWWGLAGVLILSGLLWAAALRIMHRFDRIYPKVLVR
jgi:ABC-type polysaccharide/polyol phosphate export systems, permease component